jgi:hypothetical protein
MLLVKVFTLRFSDGAIAFLEIIIKTLIEPH